MLVYSVVGTPGVGIFVVEEEHKGAASRWAEQSERGDLGLTAG